MGAEPHPDTPVHGNLLADAREGNETQAVIDAVTALGEPQEIDEERVYSVIVPAGAVHRVVRFPDEEILPGPRRPKGVYRPATVDALISVVDRFHDTDRTTVWVHPTSGQIVAVFNDNATEPGPGWRDHRAQLTLANTPEWVHWHGKDGELMTQQQFAEHVEDGAGEIVEPAAAEMLELAQTFHAHQAAKFRAAVRLQDGVVQLQYDETLDATAGTTGQMQIPSTFKLAVAPFLGEDPYAITARLRYRVNGGSLSIGYKLERPHVVLRDALDSIAARLAEKFPAVYIGDPGIS